MKKIICALLLFMSFSGYAQDLIILRSGNQINCKITKVDDNTIYYDFYKNERKLSTYVAKNDVRSYKIDAATTDEGDLSNLANQQENTVYIDTSKYVKETQKWTNLVTYSQRFGINASGWAINYYGYNLSNTRKWSIPLLIGIESFTMSDDYFAKSGYWQAQMSYYNIGVSPFYKLNDVFFLNLGLNAVLGQEELTDFSGYKKSRMFFGFSPSQGIYFIPKSKFGVTFGASVYEKILTSKAYKSDLGIKLEAGIKF